MLNFQIYYMVSDSSFGLKLHDFSRVFLANDNLCTAEPYVAQNLSQLLEIKE